MAIGDTHLSSSGRRGHHHPIRHCCPAQVADRQASLTAASTIGWRVTSHELLLVILDPHAIDGAVLRFTLLQDNFVDSLPPDAAEHMVCQNTRGYMLAFVGSVLFFDKLGKIFDCLCFHCFAISRGLALSHGKTVLAYLYQYIYTVSCAVQRGPRVTRLLPPRFSCRYVRQPIMCNMCNM